MHSYYFSIPRKRRVSAHGNKLHQPIVIQKTTSTLLREKKQNAMLKVYSECCKNCLLSKDRIVGAKRVKEILQGCARDQNHFICHKASMDGKEIVCKSFYDKFGHVSQMVRIAERMNMVEFVAQSDHEKLMTDKEMNRLVKKRKLT